ncbi:MAG: MscL family protein [Candidatus Aenigmatarchaeota archaeon]|nr:MAG: MscL family protein [Candidatus Aenigmarchaeota archaeon]
MGVFSEFKQFLQEFKVVGAAVAFVIALAVNDLVRSFVDAVLSPLLGATVNKSSLWLFSWNVGDATIKIGAFANVFVQFAITLIIVFAFVHYIIKWGEAK